MAIVLSDITEVALDGNGSFDKLMSAVRIHVADSVSKREITQAEAGAIYTGVIPSVIKEAIDFELKKDILAVQLEQEKIRLATVGYEADEAGHAAEIKGFAANIKQREVTHSKQRIITNQLENTYKRIINDQALLNTDILASKAIEAKLAEDVKAAAAESAKIGVKTAKIKNIQEQARAEAIIGDEKRKLELHDYQLDTSLANLNKIEATTKEITTQTRALSEQVVDNRWIKTVQNMGSFLGASINGGMTPSADMFQTYFGYIAKLNGIHTIQKGTIKPVTYDNTNTTTIGNTLQKLYVADNSTIEYPYGGVNKNDPMIRNDFTSHVWKIDLGYDASGKPNEVLDVSFQAYSDSGLTIEIPGALLTLDSVKTGDLIMQAGHLDSVELVRIENSVDKAA